jgi:hypothetical protein
MPDKIPSNEAMRKKGRVIDQRQQQIDPAGKRRDYNVGPGPVHDKPEPQVRKDDDDAQ